MARVSTIKLIPWQIILLVVGGFLVLFKIMTRNDPATTNASSTPVNRGPSGVM